VGWIYLNFQFNPFDADHLNKNDVILPLTQIAGEFTFSHFYGTQPVICTIFAGQNVHSISERRSPRRIGTLRHDLVKQRSDLNGQWTDQHGSKQTSLLQQSASDLLLLLSTLFGQQGVLTQCPHPPQLIPCAARINICA